MSHKKITYISMPSGVVIEKGKEYAKKKKVSKNKVIEIAVKKLLEIRTIAKSGLKKRIGSIPEDMLEQIKDGVNNYLNY